MSFGQLLTTMRNKKTKGIATIFLPHFGALAACSNLNLVENVIVHDGHRITSASWDLLEQGLVIGDTIRRTRALFPSADMRELDPTLEETQWDRILRICYEVTPQIEPVINKRYVGRWVHLQGCSRRDLQVVLERLHAPGGYAIDRDLSMIAATLAPPSTLRITKPHDGDLHHVPTEHLALFGFHIDCIRLLMDIGQANLAAVSTLTARQLQAQFHDEGKRLYKLLHPAHHTQPVPYWDPLTITAQIAIDWPINTQQQLQKALDVVTRKALSKTPDCARSLTVTATYRTTQHTGMRHLKSPTRAVAPLVDLALGLCQTSPHPSSELIGLSLSLGRLTYVAVQTNLFDKPAVEHLAMAMSRRFPGKLCQPIPTQRAFLPECHYRLSPLEPR